MPYYCTNEPAAYVSAMSPKQARNISVFSTELSIASHTHQCTQVTHRPQWEWDVPSYNTSKKAKRSAAKSKAFIVEQWDSFTQTSHNLCQQMACFYRTCSQQLPSVAENVFSRYFFAFVPHGSQSRAQPPKEQEKTHLSLTNRLLALTSMSKEQERTALPRLALNGYCGLNVLKRYNPSSFSISETLNPTWGTSEQ